MPAVRVAVFALLLANLLFLGWAEWIDVPAREPNPTANLPRLALASERPDARSAAAPAPTGDAPAAPAPQCVSVGPFDDPASAEKAADILRAKRFAPRQRTAQASAVRRYWVYLGGLKRPGQVTGILKSLERKGIDNAEAMPVEQGVRRVSLGLFSDRARAELRAGALRALGFAPKVTTRDLPGTVYWLDLRVAGGATAVPLEGLGPLTGDSQIAVAACPATVAAGPAGAGEPPPTAAPSSSVPPPGSGSTGASGPSGQPE
jgi:hypothetical protein